MNSPKRIAIIGGGISGLAALHYLKSDSAYYQVDLYEKGDQLGGTIGTDRADGYICDHGPNGFLDREPGTLELVDQLGLTDKLIQANPKAEKRFIYRNGHLHAVSPHPVKFLKSPLLSLRGRARVILEPFIRQKKDNSEESIFDFAARRIGSEAAEALVDPMVSGVFGGDAHVASLKACFPRMAQMEDEYGSLVRALIAKKKQGSRGGPAGPTGRLTSFENGTYALIEKFEQRYKDCISLNADVSKIKKTDSGFSLEIRDGSFIKSYDIVILATPSFTAAKLLSDISSEAAKLLNEIPYAPMAVCCFGYSKASMANPLDGFGFLIPHAEKREILGSIWTSSIFPDQAPPEKHLLRTMLGGYGNDKINDQSNDKLIELTTRELQDIVGVPDTPEFVRIFRWRQAIPQYLLGHTGLIERIESELEKHPGIYLTGNSYTGVGLNDCVLRSRKIYDFIRSNVSAHH